ncbi:hypothetical protein [Leptotrichia alba]|uniref:Uncharacterized protein n=1 Tax=Leptotrichia alba TaxID=3239304 RepID=A0AB39V2Q4_9FUSO
MQKRKKLIVVSSALAIGIPLLAIGTKSMLKKVKNDYYKNQKKKIEAEKIEEREEELKKLAENKIKQEQQSQIVEDKSNKNKLIIQKSFEQKQQIEEPKLQPSIVKEKTTKVKIVDAVQSSEPVSSEPVVVIKRELTKKELKQAKKALKEARASYYSGNKGPALEKNSAKNTDKIVIKTDGKGNIEVVTNRTVKNKNDKAEKIIQEIKDSYYKGKNKSLK